MLDEPENLYSGAHFCLLTLTTERNVLPAARMATPFELHPADAFASQGGAFVSVGKDVASRKQALANETLYVRARGAELLYTFPTAFYIVANTWHVRGRAAIDHLARHGSRAIAEVAARHPRMRAMLAENPQGLPPGMYYVIAPRLPPTVLERMWAVVQPSPESGPRSWERVVHERINTCVVGAVRGSRAGSLSSSHLSLARASRPFPRFDAAPGSMYQIILTLPPAGAGAAEEAHISVCW